MPVLANGYGVGPAASVLGWGYWVKVLRVYTGAIAAQVIQFETLGDGTDEALIDATVRPISGRLESARPQPAAVVLHGDLRGGPGLEVHDATSSSKRPSGGSPSAWAIRASEMGLTRFPRSARITVERLTWARLASCP